MRQFQNTACGTALATALLLPGAASALSADIQGTRLELTEDGGACINIAGEYPGIRIEPSRANKQPKLCFNSRKQNNVSFHNVVLISTNPGEGSVVLQFEQDFRDGPEGVVYGRVHLNGFFAKANGTSTPTGDRVLFYTTFLQGGEEHTIGEKLELTVGDELESAVISLSTRDKFLTSGPRKILGTLEVAFSSEGDKLVLNGASKVVLENVKRLSDLVEDEE